LTGELFSDDAVCAYGKGDNDIVVDYEEHAITVRDVKIKDLMLTPSDTFEFVTSQRWMPPV
jgi:hypothetical protein